MNSAPVTPPGNRLEPGRRQGVAPGEAGESSAPATAGDRSDPTRPRTARGARGVRGFLVFTTAGLAACALGSLWWHGSPQSSAGDHWAAVARGRYALHQGRPDLALQAVNAVRDEAPGSGEAMTVAGLALLRLGEYRGARLALERALKLQPDQFDAAITLAELNFGLGNGARGIEVLQAAARLRPQEFRVWLTMGKVHHDLGDFPKAIQAYERAIGLAPDDREALIGLIGCLMSTDQSDRAEPWAARALGRYPDDPRLLGLAARGAFDADRLDEAIALADRALARDPMNLDALVTRARAHVVRSQWEQALPDAERARAAQPNDLGSLQLLQKIQTRLGQTERAASTQAERVRAQDRIALMNRLNKEINLHPDDPELLWTMGQTAREAGSFLLASRCFEAALALDPNFHQARASLSELRAARPDLTRSPGRETLFLPEIAGVSPPSVPTPRSDPGSRRVAP
jgi:tetratricopeptide (TPR) repeat protein